MAMTDEQRTQAYKRIRIWNDGRTSNVACPVCDAGGLSVIDRSTLPYAQWYEMSCSACGLAETLHIPLAHSIMNWD